LKTCLFDVNLLVALFWTNHVHHGRARHWFFGLGDAGWATCPLTQAGFVRVSSNPRVFPDAPSPAAVVDLLETNLRHPGHCFWPDDISFGEATSALLPRLTGHQQVTDAYLLALALRNGGALATFDSGIIQLLPPEFPDRDAVVVLPL
jgi:uncharacterized protein